MGVRGLISFIKTVSLTSIADHVDLSSFVAGCDVAMVSVAVDGNAFVHWLCLEVFGNAPAVNTDYRLLKERTIEWVMKCHSAGVVPLFVFDGITEPSKLSCRMQRLAKQASHVHTVLSTLLPKHQTSDYKRDSMPVLQSQLQLQSTPPLLAIGCVIGALRACGSACCRAYYADGEADIAIVQLAVTEKAIAILSNDSDMLVYDTRGVGFIPFWAFGFADTDGSMNAFIIRRERVAGLLGISPESFPLLAALAGNDFTDEGVCQQMQRVFLHNQVVKPVRASPDTVDEVEKEPEKEDGRQPDSNTTGHPKRARTASTTSMDLDFDNSLSLSAKTPSRGAGAKPKSAQDRLKDRRRANRKQETLQRELNYLVATTESAGLSNGRSKNHPRESALKIIKSAGLFLKSLSETSKAPTAVPLTASTVAAALLRLSADDQDTLSRQPIFITLQLVLAHYDMKEHDGTIGDGPLRCCFCRKNCGCYGPHHSPREGSCESAEVPAWACLSPPLQQVVRSATFIGRTPCSLLRGDLDAYSALGYLRKKLYATLILCSISSIDSTSTHLDQPAAVNVITEILRTAGNPEDGAATAPPPSMTATQCDVTVQLHQAAVSQRSPESSLNKLCGWITSDAPLTGANSGGSHSYSDTFDVGDESDHISCQCALLELAALLFMRVSDGSGSIAAPLAFALSAACALQSARTTTVSNIGDCERNDVDRSSVVTLEYINQWTLLQQCVQCINDAWEALSLSLSLSQSVCEDTPPALPSLAPVSDVDALGIDVGLLDERAFRDMFFRLLPLVGSDDAVDDSTNEGMHTSVELAQRLVTETFGSSTRGDSEKEQQSVLIGKAMTMFKRLWKYSRKDGGNKVTLGSNGHANG